MSDKQWRENQKLMRIRWQDDIPYLEFGLVYRVGKKAKQYRVKYPSGSDTVASGYTDRKEAVIAEAKKLCAAVQFSRLIPFGTVMVRLNRLNRLMKRLNLAWRIRP